jgi:hypothetical protein
MSTTTVTCNNGHVNSERVFTGGKIRCRECVQEQYARRRERVRSLPPTKRVRNRPVCPAGCVRVCQCEDL